MLNEVRIIGNIGRDVTVTSTKSGKKVAKFSVAVTEKFTSNGERKERTEWFNVQAWGPLAEIIEQFFGSGDLVYVGGSLRTDKVEKDGQTKYYTNLVADKARVLRKKGDGAAREAAEANEVGDDDVPF